MVNRMMRIESISIENFKNVKYGKVELENRHKEYKASILGLYGQNGSGKTALIDAIQILKFALCGKNIPQKYADYVNVYADYATLKYEFVLRREESLYKIWYQFCIKKTIEEMTAGVGNETSDNTSIKLELFDEVLSFSYECNNEKLRKSPLIDTRVEGLFAPKAKMLELIGSDKNRYMELMVTKRLTNATSRSFIFSREMINEFRRTCKNDVYMTLIESMYTYGNRELFVIDTEKTGLISLDALPLSFKYKKEKSETIGNILLPLNNPALIPEDMYGDIKNVIENMNIVLEQIVPGLKIDVIDLGNTLTADGVAKQIQLMSLKNNKAIPLRYESEGIKKIVSILQLLIVVYNNSSITVAVDELDGGIFEYLLGELLSIISEKGKGQLIFTSHNLRPLETIDKGFIAFTTTNPDKRYIRMTNVKDTNNLRDFYYRDIVLGEQNEQVYNHTNNYEIALAFREAGEAFGS